MPQSHSSPASSRRFPQGGATAMVFTELGGLDKQLGWARAMKSASCSTLQSLKNSGNARFLVLGGGQKMLTWVQRPYVHASHTHLYICSCICSNLSFSAITQLEMLLGRPHLHPAASWDSPKLCPISWAMVEARPVGLSSWSCKNTTLALNSRSPPGWVKVGLDASHLVDSAWVLRTHGELIR